MESLVVFLIFIVFSVLRSLGESGQQRRGRTMPPGYPRIPGRPPVPRVQPPPPVRRQPALQEEPRRVATSKRAVKVDVSEEPAVMPPVQPEPVSKENDLKKPVASPAKTIPFKLDGDTVLMGIVLSEVLGEPKARKKQYFRRPVQ